MRTVGSSFPVIASSYPGMCVRLTLLRAVVTQQLNDGVRMLQSQAHNKDGMIQLCHTSCVRDARVGCLFRS